MKGRDCFDEPIIKRLLKAWMYASDEDLLYHWLRA